MPVSSHPQPGNQNCEAPSTPGSDAWASRDGCAASERDSHFDLQPPKTPAGTPWHGQPPTFSSPPATQVSVAGCTHAAQMPLAPPGAPERSGPFASDGACGAVVLASTEGAATRLQPIG